MIFIGPFMTLILRKLILPRSFGHRYLTLENFKDNRRLAPRGPSLDLLALRDRIAAHVTTSWRIFHLSCVQLRVGSLYWQAGRW